MAGEGEREGGREREGYLTLLTSGPAIERWLERSELERKNGEMEEGEEGWSVERWRGRTERRNMER